MRTNIRMKKVRSKSERTLDGNKQKCNQIHNKYHNIKSERHEKINKNRYRNRKTEKGKIKIRIKVDQN